jgi:hypothetical protein
MWAKLATYVALVNDRRQVEVRYGARFGVGQILSNRLEVLVVAVWGVLLVWRKYVKQIG